MVLGEAGASLFLPMQEGADFPHARLISREEFVEMLRELVVAIEEDDSFEGRVEYQCGPEKGQYYVRAFYRYGNSQGQGFSRSVESV